MLANAWFHTQKPLPDGFSYESELYEVPSHQVEFLFNLAYKAGDELQFEEQIYKAWLEMVDEAERLLVVDMFLFNAFYDEDQQFPAIAGDLVSRIVERMEEAPNLQVYIISDEVNTTYGSHSAPMLEELEQHGAVVVITETGPLRDSNPLYSMVWRVLLQWFGQAGPGWLPNPMADEAPSVTLRSYLKLLNVKANHRKVLLTEKSAMVTSANAHDASAWNSNIAFRFSGPILKDVWETERAVMSLSGIDVPLDVWDEAAADHDSMWRQEEQDNTELIGLRWLTEGRIKANLLQALEEAEAGDIIWLGMFYLSDREIVMALRNAADRGALVRLILDPNENAFGNEKIGLPNRPVADELMEHAQGSIEVRWYNTTEEQYHTKMIMIQQADRTVITGGSTNFTRRNLDDLNLESNLWVEAPRGSGLDNAVGDYFQRLWDNEDAEFTLSYEAYVDERPWIKRMLYSLQKLLGFTTY